VFLYNYNLSKIISPLTGRGGWGFWGIGFVREQVGEYGGGNRQRGNGWRRTWDLLKVEKRRNRQRGNTGSGV